MVSTDLVAIRSIYLQEAACKSSRMGLMAHKGKETEPQIKEPKDPLKFLGKRVRDVCRSSSINPMATQARLHRMTLSNLLPERSANRGLGEGSARLRRTIAILNGREELGSSGVSR